MSQFITIYNDDVKERNIVERKCSRNINTKEKREGEGSFMFWIRE